MGIEPTRPGTQVSCGFEDRGGHQYPIQPRKVRTNIIILIKPTCLQSLSPNRKVLPVYLSSFLKTDYNKMKKCFFVGEENASWLVFMVYIILGSVSDYFVWNWRILYVP